MCKNYLHKLHNLTSTVYRKTQNTASVVYFHTCKKPGDVPYEKFNEL